MRRNNIYIIVILFALSIASGCKKKEMGNPLPSTVADFTYETSNSGYAPSQVTFTNKSLNAKNYSWDFGNGQTSTEENPVVTYDTPGLYNATLVCGAQNDVYYNVLEKSLIVNVKDPLAGLTQVLYYTTRSAEGGGVHMVILDDGEPLIQDFEATDMERPYGIAVDTAHSKVYVSDYSIGAIYQFDADGKNPVKIQDASASGAIVVDPQALMVIGDKVYWGQSGGIFRCNLDGSNAENYYNNGTLPPEYPLDMQYDPLSDKIYLVNDLADYSGGFYSVNMDGTGLTEIFAGIDGTALEVDFETNKAYLAVYDIAGTVVPADRGIYMCNLDGTALSKIGDFGEKATWGIARDNLRQKLFWGFKLTNSDPDGKIIRANMDGTGQEDWLTGVSPHALAIEWVKL